MPSAMDSSGGGNEFRKLYVMRQPHNMAVAQPGKAVPLTRPEVPEV